MVNQKQFSHRLIMNNNRNQLDGEGLGRWLFSLRRGFLTMQHKWNNEKTYLQSELQKTARLCMVSPSLK